MFISMWNFCDDAGRHPNSPKQLKAEIFPSDDFLLTDVLGMIHELARIGLIECYEIEDTQYIQVTGWHHQRIDKPQKPRYPAPDPNRSQNVQGSFLPDTILYDTRDSNPIQSNPGAVEEQAPADKGTDLLKRQLLDEFAPLIKRWAAHRVDGTQRAGHLFVAQVGAGYSKAILLAAVTAYIDKNEALGVEDKFWKPMDKFMQSGDWVNVPSETAGNGLDPSKFDQVMAEAETAMQRDVLAQMAVIHSQAVVANWFARTSLTLTGDLHDVLSVLAPTRFIADRIASVFEADLLLITGAGTLQITVADPGD